MLSENSVQKIREMHRTGITYSDISKELCISYPTVVKYAKGAPIQSSARSPLRINSIARPLQSYVELIEKYVNSGITSSRKIEFLLRSAGYEGSYQTLNKHIQRLFEKRRIDKTVGYLRVETPPGEQAQVDWGHFGKIVVNGQKMNLYVFSIILSHSRARYAEFVTDQKQRTLQNCHVRAFEYLGGIPRKIRYDNMKTVVIDRKRFGDREVVQWNVDFKNFAHYFKFEPELCPIYYPRSKGKVEASIKLLRNNFYHGEANGKTYHGLEQLNNKLLEWLNTYANNRKHPVRERNIADIWVEEKKYLGDVTDLLPFANITQQVRRVSRISMVTYKGASYYVPKEFIQCKVEVCEITHNGQTYVDFYNKGEKIAQYPLAQSGGWILPDDREIIKAKGKKDDIAERVINNPLYNVKVDVRDLSYYQNLLNRKNYG